jgi:type IV pilus assembly protein PilY1
MKLIKSKSVLKDSLAARMRHCIVGVTAFLTSFALCHVQAAAPEQTPLFLSVGAKPHIALVMSVDHELFKKAYTDYANLDGENLSIEDSTYRNDFSYYGYFDPNWCYTYVNSGSVENRYFTPHSRTTDHYCLGTGNNTVTQAGAWSGNFLNWLTMTRVDIVRRVLFGGKRSVDTATNTILERAYLPQDVHAFAKVYSGADINELTPYSAARSFCNVSTTTMDSNSRPSGYPRIRVATGGPFPQWASAESTQCTTGSGVRPDSDAVTDVTAKVQVCVADKDALVLNADNTTSTSPRCGKYGNNYKPIGLLQKYGESGAIKFSLTTGSYKANLKGGVLRKKATPLVGNTTAADNEINASTGQFTGNNGIIKNISSFRIGSHNGSTNYFDCNTHSISIATVRAGTASSSRCTDWGNPLAEIYMEMLRYISGAGAPSTNFDVDDSSESGNFKGIPGLSKSTWDDPWPADEWCAQCSAIVISTGANSFDGDDLGTATNIAGLSGGASDVFAKTNVVGSHIITSGNKYFLGGLTTQTTPHRFCDGLALTQLSNFMGICPEQPALEGTYNIAGLAYHARTTDLRTHQGEQKLKTYAVDFAESVPTFSVTIPSVSSSVTVNFLPSCEATGSSTATNSSTGWQGCSLTDARIESLTRDVNGNLTSGSFLFFWEDSLWGNDYDLDAAQRIEFCVGAACNPAIDTGKIFIRNTVPYAVAGNSLRFSYSIYGVNGWAGTVFRSTSETSNTSLTGVFDGGLVQPWIIRPGNNNDNALDGALDPDFGRSEITFTASAGGTATLLQKPLFYAAKYGGFEDSNENNLPDLDSEWDRAGNSQTNGPDGIPDNFFSVKNPSLLEESLDAIFNSILAKVGSASAVATSSTRVQEGQFVYQARFDSTHWTGELLTYKVTGSGTLENSPTASTNGIAINSLTSSPGRNIVTYKPLSGSTVNFTWANLDTTQKTALELSGDPVNAGLPEKRVDWLRGSKIDEDAQTGFRVRTWKDENQNDYRNVIGDIVNSSPVFVGSTNERYYTLPSTLGGDKYTAYLNWKKGGTEQPLPTGYPATPAPRIFVGSNGGMVHAFHADTLQEIFAYVPNATFGKLANLTERNYGSSANEHQYLVDGPIVAGDAFITVPGQSARSWRSIVVGTFGAGAKGLYALDVTDESNPKVLFEYTHNDLGYILGRPVLVPTAEGRWVVIVGNGVDSGTQSKLFIIDLEEPLTKTKIMDGGSGTQEMSAPSVLTNAVGVASTVYAGNLSGEMRRFDISDASNSNWTSYKVYSAVSGDGDAQPIVAAPTIGYNSKLGRNMVYFGTGKYHDFVDKTPGSVQHSFYAVPDMGSSGQPKVRADFKRKELATDYDSSPPTRTVTDDTVNWSEKFGWYVDLDHNGTTRDERVTIKAVLIQDRLLVTTLIPSQANCLAGGSSWFMELTAVGDGYKNVKPVTAKYSPELFLGDQNVVVFVPDPGNSNSSTSSTASSGASSSTDDNCGADIQGGLISSGTSGNKPAVNQKDIKACMIGRQTWQQLK